MKNLKLILMTLVIIVVVVISFFNQKSIILLEITNTAKDEEVQINRYVDLCKGFVDLMTIYGNNWFDNAQSGDSELYDLLQVDADTGRYTLDAIGGTKYQKTAGNLTGLAGIPAQGAYRAEINLAFMLNQQFTSIYAKLPDVAWIYYSSNNNFINLYPWVPSSEFAFSEILKTEVFFTKATPENNPLRQSFWTPVYLDHAGKGLMVTHSSPIYNQDQFMGVVSIDLTNNQISEMIQSPYTTYVVDDVDTVVASNAEIPFDQEATRLEDLLQITPDEAARIKDMDVNSLQTLSGSYIYAVDVTNAPWRMFIRVPIWLVLGKSALYTLPIAIICLLLLLAFLEVEKRKKTEQLLMNSLSELTSYQTMLENAAKYDFLTATVNRRGLKDIISKNLNLNDTARLPAIFIMGDIDYFKQFNDEYGHAAGDLVLREVVRLMQETIGSNDVVCRWGGDEFVLMILDKPYDEALKIAEKIRISIASASIPWEHDQQLKATMTFGVAEYIPGESFEHCVAHADTALYVSKEKGRNQVIDYRDCHEIGYNKR